MNRREQYLKYKEHNLEYANEYREKHKEEISKYSKKYMSEYILKNKAKLQQYHKEYNEKHKELLARKRKLYKKKNEVKIKIGKLVHYFNISKEEATKLYYKKINGFCDICGKPEKSKRFLLSVDHNHETGKIRGLLCGHCNKALGGFNDNIDTLKSAIKYLKKDMYGKHYNK